MSTTVQRSIGPGRRPLAVCVLCAWLLCAWLLCAGALCAAALAGCGAGNAAIGARATRAGELDLVAFVHEIAVATRPSLALPAGDEATLAAAARAARGDERRTRFRDLALARMWLADAETDERAARRQRRGALEAVREAAKRNNDDELTLDLAFVELWVGWRGALPTAARAAERFTERTAQGTGDLRFIGWIVRGEIAIAGSRWADAAQAYRWLLAELDHPLYALGLYRTAHIYREEGRNDDARQAMREAAAAGDAPTAHAWARKVSLAAHAATGTQPPPPAEP